MSALHAGDAIRYVEGNPATHPPGGIKVLVRVMGTWPVENTWVERNSVSVCDGEVWTHVPEVTTR